jgi:hypothetical protein
VHELKQLVVSMAALASEEVDNRLAARLCLGGATKDGDGLGPALEHVKSTLCQWKPLIVRFRSPEWSPSAGQTLLPPNSSELPSGSTCSR